MGSLAQAYASQVPAAVTAKLGSGGASLSRLWDVGGLRLPVIVEFALPEPAGKGLAKGVAEDDQTLTTSIHAAQDAILFRLFGAGMQPALAAGSPQNLRRMDFSPMFAMSVSAAEVERLALDTQVVRIHADTLSYPQLVQTVPLTGMPNAYASGATGEGQVIAILDSGVRSSHEFLAGKVIDEACLSNADASAGIVSACPSGALSLTGGSSADDCDPAVALGCGHGTHLAGIAAGFNTNVQAGEPQNGMSRAAKLFAVNVMSRALPGSAACAEGCLVSFASSQILGLEAVYARRAKLPVAAVALGLAERGTDAANCGIDPRAPIIERLREAGIATVVAAGNDASDTRVAGPACIPAAIAVAASTKQDQRAFFSNWGPQVDLVAPGAEILSSAVAGQSRTGYAALSGTSMAVPHVAGAIAALRSVMSEASVDQIEDALKASGVPITSAGVTKQRIRVDQALLAVARPMAPPANDNFANRIAIPPTGGGVSGNNVDATFETGEPTHAGRSGSIRSVWWSFTPATSVDVVISTGGSEFDTILAVYAGSTLSTLGEVVSNDDIQDGVNFQSRVQFHAVGGTQYQIAVTGYDATKMGAISLSVTLPPRPANDDFANRIAINSQGTVTGSNLNATAEPGEPIHFLPGSPAVNSVWWQYTAAAAGLLTIETMGSNFDTVLAVYTGTAFNNLSEVASNDDTLGSQSRVSFLAVQGATYVIAVQGFNVEKVGDIRLTVASQPSNDNFANRITLSAPATVTGNNILATAESGEPNHAGASSPTRSVWWTFTPAASGPYSLDTTGSNFDTVLAVYTGSAVNGLTQVAANDNIDNGNPRSRLTFTATAGIPYAIAVAGVGNSGGAITLALAAVVPSNDNFANRITIAGVGTVNGTTFNATTETGEPNHYPSDNSRKSVWYKFTPSVSGTYAFRVTGNFDVAVAAYTGSAVDGLTPVGDRLEDFDLLALRATAGVSYAIAVAGIFGGPGNFSLNLATGPANDDFANRVVIAGPGTLTGTNVNSSSEAGEPAHTGAFPIRSVWWRFTPATSGQVTLETTGSNFDTALAVYTGSSFATFAEVTSNNDIGGGNLQSRVTFEATAGTQYQIAVAGFSGTVGAISLTLTGPPPPNDNFANRTTVASFGTVTGSNVFATSEAGEPDHDGLVTHTSVWWSFTPTVNGPLTISTAGSAFDTVIAVYTGSAVNALSPVVSNDDDNGAPQSRVTFTATAGTSYAIAVTGINDATGAISLAVNGVPPVNDNFANRTVIAGPGTVTGGNIYSTAEANEPNYSGAAAPVRSVWWRFTPATSGQYTIDTTGSNFDTVLAVYTGSSFATFAEVASNDNIGGGSVQSRVSFLAVGGTQYQIVVAGKAGAMGSVNLALTLLPAPVNDNFANRMTIAAPGSVTGTTVNATPETGEPNHYPGDPSRLSVWYKFTPSASGAFTFRVTASFDIILAGYTGSAVNALTAAGELQEDNDVLVLRAVAGQSYAIAIAGFSGAEGAFSLTVGVAPTNDDFASRVALAGPGTVTGSNVNATAEPGEANHTGAADPVRSVWWSFTPARSGQYTLETTGSNFDTVLSVYVGSSFATFAAVAFNDDIGGGNVRSRVVFQGTAGTQYQIVVAGKAGATGAISLILQPPPANDNFANRIAVAFTAPGPATATGTNVNATSESGEPTHAGVSVPLRSVWWSFTATSTRRLIIDTRGSNFDTTLAVYTGTAPNALTLVASNDDLPGSVQSLVEFTPTANTQYQIAVSGAGGATGAISLSIDRRPSNDNFASARVLNGGQGDSLTNVNATAETGEPNHAGNASARTSIWYQFTPTRTGTAEVRTAAPVAFDTVVAIYTGGSLATLTPVASTTIATGFVGTINVSVVAGTTYRVALAGVNNATGTNNVLIYSMFVPQNDNFADALDFALFAPPPGFFTNNPIGNALNALPEPGEPIHAGNATARNSIWYHFTPSVTGSLTFDLSPSDFDTVLAVYTGSAVNALTPVASNDNIGGGNLRSRVTFLANAGTRYYFAITGNNNSFGTGDVTATFQSVPPANDAFANRTTISAFGTVSGVSGYATAETGEPNHAGNATARTSVWWRFTPGVTGPLTVQTVGSSFNTVLGVYTGSAVNGLTQVAANDDIGGGNLQSRVTFNAVAGTSYAIAVAGVSNAAGNITLAVSSVAPANDAFANRVTIAAFGSATGNNAYATPETGEPNHAGNATAGTSVWWRFTSGVTGPLTVQTVGSSFNTVLGVYTGNTVSGLAQVAANDDIGGGVLQSRVTFNATAGVSYAIAVAGVSNASGNITLAVNSVPPANDNFANRVTIVAFGTVTGASGYATAETGEPNHAGNATARTSVWWRFMPTVSGPLQVQTVGSSFNTVLGVYTGSAVNGLTQVAANDDIGGGVVQSRVTFNATAGVSYAIAVAGVGNASGTVTLAVNSVAPANDNFANRITVAAPGTVTGANAYATAETGEPLHAGVAAARGSVWWRYTPAVSGPVLVDTMGSDFATVLAVYTGATVNALAPVASNNDAHGGTNRSKLSFNGVAGTSYAIAVSGETAALTGAISLRIGGGVATPLPVIVSAVTPVARAALVNSTVTAFATVINAGPGVASSCFIAKPLGAPSVSFSYRTITNGVLGTANAPVNIAAGAAQAFVMSLSSSAALQSNLALVFDCANTQPASSTAGLNTFLITATNAPAPADLVSVAVTPSGDGILNVPVNGTGFASLAAQNIGTAASLQARLSASAIGAPAATLPLTMVVCQTNPSNGACLQPATGTTVNFNLGVNQVATFAAFLTYTGTTIPFDPANKRVFVHFFQGTTPVGSASVAVRTTAPDATGETAPPNGKQAMAE